MSALADMLIDGAPIGEGRRYMQRAPADSVFRPPAPPRVEVRGRPLDRQEVFERLDHEALSAHDAGNLKLARRLQNKSQRWKECHRVTHAQDLLGCADLCDGELEYHPHSCMVAGCPYCSKLQSRRLREHYEPAMLALWHKREHGAWRGRFWFYTPTMRMSDGETIPDAVAIFRQGIREHLPWVTAEFGKDESGFICAMEIGPGGLQRGTAKQIHAHTFLAVNSNVQLSPKRLVVRSGVIENVKSDFAGELNKRKIERDWCERVRRESPVSRIYEIAPRELPLELDPETVRLRLESIGTDSVEKMLRVNTRATMGSAAAELLKYVTKTAYLDAASLVEVIVTLDNQRRIFAQGLFYGQRRKELIAWYAAHVEPPEGDAAAHRGVCPICGRKKMLRDSGHMPRAVVASALRDYLERRGWLTAGQAYGLILANKCGRPPPKWSYSLGPKALLDWLRELERGCS